MRKFTRTPAILLAVVLQLVPLVRTICTHPAATSAFAVILRWGIGAAAAMGAYDTVSGASGVYYITPNSATGYVGVPFNYKAVITNVGSDPGAVFAVAPALPAGLTNGTYDHAPNVYGIIAGTPTTPVTNATYFFTFSYPGQTSATTNFHLYIFPAAPGIAPSITNQPVGATNLAGGSGTFSVGADGTAPLRYQWRFNGGSIANATNSSLALTNIRLTQAGDFTVVVSNSVNPPTTSSIAHLAVNVPPAPTLQSPPGASNKFIFTFTPVVGLTNSVLTNSGFGGTPWAVFTNIMPPASPSAITVTDSVSGPLKFYRVQFSP